LTVDSRQLESGDIPSLLFVEAPARGACMPLKCLADLSRSVLTLLIGMLLIGMFLIGEPASTQGHQIWVFPNPMG
jgi:hypothetical protein